MTKLMPFKQYLTMVTWARLRNWYWQQPLRIRWTFQELVALAQLFKTPVYREMLPLATPRTYGGMKQTMPSKRDS